MKFINREKELSALEKIYQKNEFQFIPVYGRRRIGKTRLIQEFIKDKNAIYFLADSALECVLYCKTDPRCNRILTHP